MKMHILSLLLLLSLLLAAHPAYAATGKITTINMTNLYDAYNSTSKAWNELKTAKHRLNGQIVYCLQHKKSVPNSQTYNLTNLMSYYSAKVQKGLQIILENGYPWANGGLSAAQAEYATANAIRFWLSECGDSQFYNQTNLGSFSDAKLRSLAASGLITKKIRVRKDSYIPALQFSVELLIKARAQTVMQHDVALSAANVNAARSGDSFIGSTSVTVVNLKGGYTLDKSALPSGSMVSGYTGKDGDTLTVSIPTSTATANRSYTLTLTGMDDRAIGNMQVFNHNSNTDYQRVLAVRAGQDRYEVVVTRTLTVTTGNFIPPQPDLIVSALTPGQSSYTAGSGISVTATVKNQGTASAGGFYVSLNSGGSQSSYVNGLAVDASTTVSFNLTAPATAQTLTLTATADSTNIVAESNETNNTRSTSVAIIVPAYPDLTVVSVSPAVPSYNAGETVTVSSVIRNQGNAATGTFVVKFTPEGMSSQTQTVTGLAAGDSQTLTWAFTAPRLTATASRSLTVQADSTNVVSESNENNNTGTGSVTIIGANPDLTVTSVTPAAPSYSAGKTVTISSVIKNQGNAAAGTFVVKSTPQGMSSQTQTVTGLAAGASQTLTWTFVAPMLTATASRSLTVQADSTNVVSESNESNNTGTGSVTIIGEIPDLTVTALTVDASVYEPGERVTITATVKNNGIIACPASKLRLAGDGMTAQTKDVSALPAGGTQTVSFTLTAPQIVGEVTYNITATADPDKQIVESNESNNSRGGSFKVSNPLPDLTVTQIRSDKNEYDEGATGTVTVTVKNQGAQAVSNAKLKLTLGDFFSEVRQTGSILAGGTAQITFGFVAPETLERRTVIATAIVDPTNEIPETNEDNNTLTGSLMVKPILPDLAVTSTNAANWYAGKEIVVTATVVNYTSRDVPEVAVRLTLGGARYEESVPLPGNGTNLAVFRVTLPTTIGATDVRFVVDPYNAIPEQDKGNNDLDKTIEIVAVPTGAVLDPDLPAMEERFKQGGLLPLPDTANSDYHIWQEVRLEGGAYVTKTFWAQLRTAFAIAPDPRIAYEDDPTRMESGFGLQAGLQTVLTTNYDRPEKLVGVQMAWTFSPESGYGQIPEWSGTFDALEAATGAPGDWNVIWQYAVNPWSETGNRLHYTPLWFPDGQFTVLSQAFYSWTPAGQLYWYDAASVDILGDMYDRVTAIQGR